MTKKLPPLPEFAFWLRDYCASRSHPAIKTASIAVAELSDVHADLPLDYRWRFSTDDSLERQCAGKSPREVNRIYWTDHARNIEAYSIMSTWRSVELVTSTIQGLNAREIVPSAVLARSLLELSCAFLVHAQFLHRELETLQFPPGLFVPNEEMEKYIVKMIWGTRVGDPAEHLKQINILTIIKKVSTDPKAKDILPIYEFLCDIAHPSFIGNTRFWSHIEEIAPDGSERRVLSRDSSAHLSEEILDKILLILGWSAIVIRNAFLLTQGTIAHLLTKIDPGGTQRNTGRTRR